MNSLDERRGYEDEKSLLRQMADVYDKWPNQPECVKRARLIRNAVDALERLEEMEKQTGAQR